LYAFVINIQELVKHHVMITASVLLGAIRKSWVFRQIFATGFEAVNSDHFASETPSGVGDIGFKPRVREEVCELRRAAQDTRIYW
jgi:hypothetical protein